MALRPLLDLIFPPQCASCNALGCGFCDACAKSAQRITVWFPSLRVTAFGSYEGSLRSAILALKDGRRDVAEALSRAVAPLVERGGLLLPVPTTPRRRRVRGLDGVALVARSAAEIAGAGILAALEHRSGDAQRGRSRGERLAARGRFACDPANIAARRVTLFDDVCTTGSTLRDCAAAVREAGGFVEDAVVVAVTKSGQPWRSPLAS
jgi:predicted amidophosphoribosyltransferase